MSVVEHISVSVENHVVQVIFGEFRLVLSFTIPEMHMFTNASTKLKVDTPDDVSDMNCFMFAKGTWTSTELVITARTGEVIRITQAIPKKLRGIKIRSKPTYRILRRLKDLQWKVPAIEIRNDILKTQLRDLSESNDKLRKVLTDLIDSTSSLKSEFKKAQAEVRRLQYELQAHKIHGTQTNCRFEK